MTEEVNENQAVQQQEAPQSKEETSGADLNISDLIALKNIIEVATQRGAFKAGELEAVGKTFNKLNSFLESVIKKDE